MTARIAVRRFDNEPMPKLRTGFSKDKRLFRILYAGFTGLNEFSKLSALSYSP